MGNRNSSKLNRGCFEFSIRTASVKKVGNSESSRSAVTARWSVVVDVLMVCCVSSLLFTWRHPKFMMLTSTFFCGIFLAMDLRDRLAVG